MSDFKQLLEASVLNEESKAVISEAFDAAVEIKAKQIKEQHEIQLAEAKSEMIVQAAAMIEEAVAEELEAISEEIEHARTLDVQYAEKLKVFKESYAERQEEAVKVMVAEAVAEELEDVKEDMERAKKFEFAMTIFEGYKEVYEKMFGCDDVSIVDQLSEAKKELDNLKREKIISGILESVAGNKREVVSTLLESTPTEKLEARFESLKSILLAEPSEKEEEKSLNESAESGEIRGEVILENAEEVEVKEEVLSAAEQKLQRSLKFARI